MTEDEINKIHLKYLPTLWEKLSQLNFDTVDSNLMLQFKQMTLSLFVEQNNSMIEDILNITKNYKQELQNSNNSLDLCLIHPNLLNMTDIYYYILYLQNLHNHMTNALAINSNITSPQKLQECLNNPSSSISISLIPASKHSDINITASRISIHLEFAKVVWEHRKVMLELELQDKQHKQSEAIVEQNAKIVQLTEKTTEYNFWIMIGSIAVGVGAVIELLVFLNQIAKWICDL